MGKTSDPGIKQTETMETDAQPGTLPHRHILRTVKTHSRKPVAFYRTSSQIKFEASRAEALWLPHVSDRWRPAFQQYS